MRKWTAVALVLIGIASVSLVGHKADRRLASPNQNEHQSDGERSLPAATSGQPQAQGATQSMLEEIAAWLSQNFDLPQTSDLPAVRHLPPFEMMSVRLQPLMDEQRHKVVTSLRAGTLMGREPLALYDNRTKTIFLAEAWSSSNRADVSILVHEMVHHLQNLAAHTFMCPQE